VDDVQAENLLTGLVTQYSPSTQERPAVEYLIEQMQALGFEASIDEAGNAVGVRGEGRNTLLMLGHIDTVPGQIEVRKEENLLYGRGSVDAKGPLAAFVCAAARATPRPDLRIVVVGAVEEEAATSKGARALLRRMRGGNHDPIPAAVIVGEPSHWDRITVGYKGRLLLDYQLERELGHTAGPQKSTCEEAVAFWLRVEDYAARWNADRKRMFEQLTPSLRSIHSSSDGLHEQVSMTLGFRLPLKIDIDELQATLLSLGQDAKQRFRGREVAYRAPKNTPLVRAFLRAIRAQGERPKFQVKSGTSDMNVVGPAWQCPILAYGPGDSSLDHTPHEHIELSEYHRAISVLTSVLENIQITSQQANRPTPRP
jgi:LysW-gamma-L-lysine carboxypeptidase